MLPGNGQRSNPSTLGFTLQRSLAVRCRWFSLPSCSVGLQAASASGNHLVQLFAMPFTDPVRWCSAAATWCCPCWPRWSSRAGSASVPGGIWRRAGRSRAAVHLRSVSRHGGGRAERRLGGLICLVAIYLPSFLLLLGSAILGLAARRADVLAALRGVNAAVVGLLLAALYTPVWTTPSRAARFRRRDRGVPSVGVLEGAPLARRHRVRGCDGSARLARLRGRVSGVYCSSLSLANLCRVSRSSKAHDGLLADAAATASSGAPAVRAGRRNQGAAPAPVEGLKAHSRPSSVSASQRRARLRYGSLRTCQGGL